MVDQFRILMDGVFRGSSPSDFGIQIQFDQSVNGVFVTFENDLLLTGSAYKYLLDNAKSQFCGRVEVQCLYLCQGQQWINLATGFIFLSDCVFNRDLCQVTTKIVDESFQSRINNNKAIEIYSETPTTKNGDVIGAPIGVLLTGQRAQMFVPATGVYLSQYSYGWSVFNAFKILISFMSDGEMDFESNYFETGPGNAYFVTSGRSIRIGSGSQFLYSFESLYTALNKKLQLGFGFKKVNGRPVIMIEKFDFFRDNPAIVELYNVHGIKSRVDKDRMFSSIDLGSDDFLEEWQSTNPNAALSFSQVRFFGFKKESFGLTGLCNIDKKLDLVTQKVIFDTNIIEDILMNGNQGYEENPIIIELTAYAGSAETYVTQPAGFEDIFSSGTVQYNPNLTNDHQALNNINGVPASIWNWYQGYDAANTVFKGTDNRANFSLTLTLTPTIQYYSDPDKMNEYFRFPVQVTDIGSNYDPVVNGNPAPVNGSRYVAPAPGAYTFFTRIKKTGLGNQAAVITTRVIFVRYNSNNELIVKHFQAPQNNPGNVPACITATDTFFCNEGDKIFVDIEFYLDFATSTNYEFTSNLAATVCVGEPVEFSGSGVPIGGGELQPFDATAYRPVIETFSYPLTFAQVLDLINDTTRSVAYTNQENDPLALKNGDILKITIPSLGTNLASFELKTSSF